jgi:hypothetical protein
VEEVWQAVLVLWSRSSAAPKIEHVFKSEESCNGRPDVPTLVPNVALVIASCDRSADLWPGLMTSFAKFWADCSLPSYLITNTLQPNQPMVTTIRVGNDSSWSDTLLSGLKKVPEEFVLLWIDDHYLTRAVDSRRVDATIRAFVETPGANYLRLQTLPKADRRFNGHFGVILPGHVYRTSVIASLWRKSVLEGLLRSGESAWQFETNGSVRADHVAGFFAAWREHFAIENMMIKGKLRRVSLWRFERAVKGRLNTRRPRMTVGQELMFLPRIIGNKILVRMPAGTGRYLQHILTGIRGKVFAVEKPGASCT